MKMGTIFSSETSVDISRTTRRYNLQYLYSSYSATFWISVQVKWLVLEFRGPWCDSWLRGRACTGWRFSRLALRQMVGYYLQTAQSPFLLNSLFTITLPLFTYYFKKTSSNKDIEGIYTTELNNSYIRTTYKSTRLTMGCVNNTLTASLHCTCWQRLLY